MVASEHDVQQAERRSLFWPTVFTLISLPILIGLGVWQVERLAWKEALIASINEGLAQTPVPLEEPKDAWKDLANKEYRPVTVTGHFLYQDERHLFSADHGEMGWHVYTPLETKAGNVVFVNRGFVPDGLKAAASRAAGNVGGEVAVTGLMRKPGAKGWFDADADQVRNVWLWRDLDGMTASLPEAERRRVLPFFIDAAAEPSNPGGWPRGGVTRLDIPNRHLEYALTWFGLAVTLVCIYAVFAWPRLRRSA